MEIQSLLLSQKEKLKKLLDKQELAFGEIMFNNGQCQVLSQSSARYELIVNDEANKELAEYALDIEEDGNIIPKINNNASGWNRNSFACLLQVESEIRLLGTRIQTEHKKYTREGMIKRVVKERRQKADKATYRIKWAANRHGDHILTNEKGIKYKVFLRDFENETGYSNSMDSRLNKLGTTKHIMYTFKVLKENPELLDKMDGTYPFVEIFCDPLNDYKITWHYPGSLSVDEQLLLSRYFKSSNSIDDHEATNLLNFIQEAEPFEHIRIRPEVIEKVEAAFEKKMLESLQETYTPNFTPIKAELYPYQKEGILFALFRKTAVIADEMGLGKTVQAIGAAILKKNIFDFTKTLIICPASLKEQWKKEIEKFSDEQALVVQGTPDERAQQYKDSAYYFYIINYETVLRDQISINQAGFDLLILDEAQRGKNYETKTAASLSRIITKHKLAITGTPIENRLIDIYSVMGILDPHFFGPLWEFSYQHCLFDPERPNKINGYYNLQKLNKKLDKILIRREKQNVIDQLPDLRQITIPVNLSSLQADYHASYARGLAQILRKKFLTPFDLQRMQLLLANMRMVCDSSYLIDDQTNDSPKLNELQTILIDKLDVPNKNAKIIIFSEWVKVHKLIGKLLRSNNIGFVELNGSIPVKSRGELIRKFETNPQYKVFLSTEAGGAGLNLQVADTLINFELPWNPAKKNQRIGRINRLGQKSSKLTVYNLISRNSIEQQIASGLLVKQSLFDGVLGDCTGINSVDFSTKGRSQFIQQLEDFLAETEKQELYSDDDFEASLLTESQPEGESQAFAPEAASEVSDESPNADTLDFSCEAQEQEDIPASQNHGNQSVKAEELESVMNNGMQFLSGLFKMSTGKDLGIENQKIEVNKETGEVVMRFKLPGF